MSTTENHVDITTLGAIGEFVGGIAVIGSLIYVGFQVRQSNEQAAQRNEIERNESERQFARDTSSLLLALTDPDLSRVFRQGLVDHESLTKDEQLRFDMWLSGLTNHCVSIWRRGLMHEPWVRTWLDWLVSVKKTPGGGVWWESTKLRYLPDFVDEVEELARSQDSVPAVTELHAWFQPD